MLCGGKGNVQQLDQELTAFVNSLKSQVEAKANATFTTFEPVAYRSQVVAGTNYFVKVKTDNDKYVHVTIFKALPCYGGEATVKDVQVGLTLESQL